MTGSGEKHAQDKNLIWCILMALRPILLLTVYRNTLYIHNVFFCFRCHYACSDKFKTDVINRGKGVYHAPCNPDDESQESQETTRQPRTPRTRTTTMMYARGRGGSGGNASKKSTGSCPGSLEDCFAACPGANVRVYRLCTADCSRRCSKK